jgi:hypothetical protein
MRRFTFLLALLAIFALSACGVRAQSAGDTLLSSPVPSINQAFVNPALSSSLRGALLASARSAPAPAPAPQEVQGVFPELYWQASADFTYMRFYEVPNTVVNTSGISVSMAYFFKDWLGAEGVLDGGFGTQNGQSTKSVFSGGGVRARLAGPRAVELWIHAVGGGAHFSPRTNFGGEGAFGYEAGGGVDFNAHHQKLAYRFGADLLGTSFFGTYQFSPKLSAGIVYKF